MAQSRGESQGSSGGSGAIRAARLLLWTADALLIAIGVFCALLLIVRFVVFPQVESHRPAIAAALSSRLGEPIEIDAIGTGWDGWNPKLSIRGFRIRDRANPTDEPLLDLPRVDLIVAWTSLPLLEFRLRELVVDGPRLSIRRDTSGRLRIAGMTIDTERQSEDALVGDWLLRQREIVVTNALVTWDDELRNAPQLVLDQVQFRLEHSFSHHRFGLTGMPPSELASPVDFRGDVVGLAADWQKASGKFYLRLDYADVAAWREYLSLPLPVDSGKGALRLWLDIASGQPRDVTADLVLADVRTKLAADLPPLELKRLSGRAGWKQDAGHNELYTNALAFEAMDGTTLAPTDFTFSHQDAADGRAASGKLAFVRLELAPLTALAAHLPLPQGVRHDIARYAPRGTLNDGKYAWEGEADAPAKFSASGAFDALGVNAQEVFPGGSGVSGRFDATESKGTLKLASHNMTLDLPRVFAEPIALDSAAGSVRWERASESLQVTVDDLTFANGHAAGNAAGTWRSTPAGGPGIIDLKGRLTRASVEHLYQYVPRTINPNVREWVHRAIVHGTSNDVRLVLNGNLAEFPFPQGRNGQFLITIKGQGGTLDYVEHWPPITDVDADIRFEGARLVVDAPTGKVFGAQIGRTRAEIADLHHPVLRVVGEATGPTKEFLTFIVQSPVAEWIGHVSDGAQAVGNGHLALNFDLPLGDPHNANVSGDYQFMGNELRIVGAPELTQLNGKLSFTGHSLSGRDITAQALGGPLKLEVGGSDGRVRVSGAGTASLAQLKTQVDSPLIDRLSGDTDYQIAVNARQQAATWSVESSLKGAAIDLPAPLGKTADQVVPLRIERREATPARREEVLAIDYGAIARLTLRRPSPDAAFDRALLLLGKAVERTADSDRAGFWVRADLPSLDLDDWLSFGRSLPARAAATSASLDFNGADIDASALYALGRKFRDANIAARRAGDEWRVAIAGPDVAGTAVWGDPTSATPNGRVVARLARLTMPAAGDAPSSAQTTRKSARPAGGAPAWPAIDLTSDAFYSKDNELGKLALKARPAGNDWQIESLTIKNDSGTISAEGWWRAGEPQQTKLDVAVDVDEAGAFLAHFGLADAIRGAATSIKGQVGWPGSPGDFDYRALNGTFQVKAGVGQFMKADPGVGRLLGVLSLQALPRRVSLDFRDVFSEGFAFDAIDGSARIQEGLLSTDNLRMVGPAATVNISGTVDLVKETEKLRVRVQPALATSVSAGAAALFIANPLIGAAVGAGTLLAQKVLKDPIEQLFSYEYAVTGGWSDPVVERVNNRTAAATPATVAK